MARRSERRLEMADEIRIDRIRCDGHGLCAELLPELIELDDWGYPLLAPGPVPEHLREHARQAVAACPVVALRLERVAAAIQSGRRA
jgi:ferredoxin